MNRLLSTAVGRRRAQPRRAPRPGFTLLELLIAVSIMLILLAITASAIKVTSDADRVRGAARQIQSYLLGARDRAIYAKAPRGVRFLRGGSGGALSDPNDRANRLVTSMVYIEPTEPWQGQVIVLPLNPNQPWHATNNPLRRLRLQNANAVPNWQDLVNQGLLTKDLRVQIPASNRGTWYVIQGLQLNANYSGNPLGLGNGPFQELVLATEYRSPNPTGINYEMARIELPPTVMPNQEPVELPKGVAIDLDRCGVWSSVLSCAAYTGNPSDPVYFPNKLPASWKGTTVTNGSADYNQRMDLMFSPRGTIFGPEAAQGVIQLYVTETRNLLGLPMNISLSGSANASGTTYAQLLDPAYGEQASGSLDPPAVDKSVVTIFTQTGQVICSPVRTQDSNNDGFADDPFYFSERGEVAGR